MSIIPFLMIAALVLLSGQPVRTRPQQQDKLDNNYQDKKHQENLLQDKLVHDKKYQDKQLQDKSYHDKLVQEQRRQFKTNVLLNKIMNEIRDVEPPLMKPQDSMPQDIASMLVKQNSLLGEGENLFANPINEDTSCLNESICSRFEFDLSLGGRPVSVIHIWIHKLEAREPLFASACVSRSPEQPWCLQELDLKEMKSEQKWAVFEIQPNQELLDYMQEGGEQLFVAVETFGTTVDLGKKPTLVSSPKAANARHQRRRRSTDQPPLGPGKANCSCCMQELFVNFKDINWHWVVAPLGFNANMCVGKCSGVINSFPRHYHTMMSTLTKNHTSFGGVGEGGRKQDLDWKPCCSPTKLGSLDLIYEAANATATNATASFIYHKIPDMVTEACGCW